MRHCFVTGGSGFVGRNLIAALVDHGDRVSALARSEQAAQTVRSLGAGPVIGDLNNIAALKSGMQGCNVVFHAGALASQWGPVRDFYKVNVLGTQCVLDAARAAGVARLVHVSTEAVLLDGSPLVNVTEARPRPDNPLPRYADSKARAEARVLRACDDDFATVVVRPRLVWGAGDTSVFPQIMSAVRQGRFMWIGGGWHLTSTCHVANVCEGLLLAAEHGRAGEIYFLTDGQPVPLREFITALLGTQGLVAPTKSIPYGVAALLAKLCEPVWAVLKLKSEPPINQTALNLLGREITVNDSKARRELGYQAKMSREDGLDAMRLSDERQP